MEKLNLTLINGPRLVHCNFTTREIPKQLKPTKRGFQVECKYMLKVNIDNDKNEVSVLMSAVSDTENIPFSFDIKSEAKFKCEDNCPSEQHAIIEAVPYIFLFLKEAVADLTRKAYLSPFYLPPLDLRIDKLEMKNE